MASQPLTPDEQRKQNATLADFLKAFLIPMIPNKMVMLYFGLKYAEYPGDGYGYGLAATMIFFLITMARFLWKYRNIEDP